MNSLQAYLEEKYPVTITVTENEYRIVVEAFVVKQSRRNEGIGTKVMQEVQAYAKDAHKPLFLTPSTDFGGNLRRLKKFYQKLGFVQNLGRNKDFASACAYIWKE